MVCLEVNVGCLGSRIKNVHSGLISGAGPTFKAFSSRLIGGIFIRSSCASSVARMKKQISSNFT